MIDIRIDKAIQLFRLAALSLILAGCATQAPIEPAPAPEPVPKPEPIVVEPEPEPVPEESPLRVAILISDELPIFTGIATQIIERGPRHEYRSFNLQRANDLPQEVRAALRRFEPDKIVAIGLRAAEAGRQLADTPMVFCKVFNYQDHDLLSSTSQGVNFLPPFDLQLDIWRDINPQLETVGLIVGPNQGDLIAEIEAATAHHGVRLLTRMVNSDKETLYAFKRLTPRIQGLWLLPDNRILSPGVLREIVTYNRRYGNQTAVFNPGLLKLGADISFSSVDTDVADAVLKAIGSVRDKDEPIGPRMTALTTLKLDTNDDLSAASSATDEPQSVLSQD